jgi:hypothetical protein
VSDTESGDRTSRRSHDRAQSEVIGEVLLLGIVVITVSVVGLAVVSDYQDRAAAERPEVDISGDVDSSWATVTHVGGRGVSLADLELVLRSDGAESRYALDDPAVTLEDDDGDGVFEAGETANVSHSYDGTVRLLLIDTTEPTRILYDREFEVSDGGGSDDGPTVEQFDVNDTSSDGDASFDVTWRATDASGDVTGATLELRDQETGAVQGVESYSFGGTGDTGTQTGNLTNTSGAGRVYVLELSVTDAAGNTATETVVDTADSEFRNDPVVQTFDVTDTSNGNDATYEVTYNVTDEDGDLTEVTLELVDADGTVRDTVTDTYNETGGTGDVTRSLSYTAGKSKGETFYINVTATDANGGTAEQSVTDVANGDGGGGGGAQAPTIERFDVTAQSCGEYDIDWRVTDDQADLDTVTVELQRRPGNSPNYKTEDSADYTPGGTGEASDVVTLSANNIKCSDGVRIVITATDTAGNSASDQRTP